MTRPSFLRPAVPAIADPGGTIVAAAHARGLRVRPLVGPSSILLALMAPGSNGQRFRFHGYLPVPADARTASLKALERESKARSRNTGVHRDAVSQRVDVRRRSCRVRAGDALAVAVDLTGPAEFVARMQTAQQWQARRATFAATPPAVFCLLAD